MAEGTIQSNKFASIGRLYPNINLFTSSDYVAVGRTNINITVTSEYPNIRQGFVYTDVEVVVQQYRNGKWNNIASRTGYVSPSSPMTRVFTNVNTAYNLRVRFKLDHLAAYPTKYYYLSRY